MQTDTSFSLWSTVLFCVILHSLVSITDPAKLFVLPIYIGCTIEYACEWCLSGSMKNKCGFMDRIELTLVGCNEQWGRGGLEQVNTITYSENIFF